MVWILLAATIIFSNPKAIFAQANTTTANPPATYSAGFSVVCAGAGDCVTVTLTAAGVSAIRELWVESGSAATISIIRRTALDTGGTSSTITLVKSDTQDAAPNSIVTAYTVVPTPGASAGTAFILPLAAAATLVRDSTVANYKPFLIQSTAETYAISVSTGTTLTVNLVIAEIR
jgi:hypothetical protein